MNNAHGDTIFDAIPHIEPESGNIRETKPIDGEFAVSGTFSSIQDVIDFKEGTADFQYGYYRFIPHPYLKTIQESLKSHFQARQVVLYNSLRSAMMEILRYLNVSPRIESVRIFIDEETEFHCNLRQDAESESYHTIDVTIASTDALSTEVEVDRKRWLIFLLNRFSDYPELLQRSGATLTGKQNIAVFAKMPSPDPVDLSAAKLWCCPLNHPGDQIRGAALFGNAERQLMELSGRTKRRGYQLSSRNAKVLLSGTSVSTTKQTSRDVNTRLTELEGGQAAFLFPSGMNAVQTVLDLVRSGERRHVISVGHLYRDTFTSLKNAPRCDSVPENTFLGVDNLNALDEAITPYTAAIVTESITNPLNDVPDLKYIQQVAARHDIPVIVDNTIATPYNCKPFTYGADFIIHSTTKFLNGKNDHGGGAVIVRTAENAEKIRAYQHRWDNCMSPLEAEALLKNMQDFPERMARFNANALALVNLLEEESRVKEIYFSTLESHRTYRVARRILSGHSSVVSFTLQDDSVAGLKNFYDQSLPHIDKAPTLGSDHTLICPYTLLTHYKEPEAYLNSVNLPRYLIRIAVGCEPDFQPVLDSIAGAFRNPED